MIIENTEPGHPLGILERCLVDAFNCGATDLHFESTGEQVMVRIRTGGFLKPHPDLPAGEFNKFIDAMLRTCGSNWHDRSRPLRVTFNARELLPLDVDLGCCLFLDAAGRLNLVIRILTLNPPIPLDKLSLSSSVLEALAKPVYGLLLCSGATGSGRSTLLASVLGHWIDQESKILKINDETDFNWQGTCSYRNVSNLNYSTESGISFEQLMKVIPHMDPDVVEIGHIKGPNKIPFAVDAALAGYLVLAELYANSAAEAVLRFLEYGKDVYERMLVDALQVVSCQRLLKRLCSCKERVALADDQIERLVQTYCKGTPASVRPTDRVQLEHTLSRWTASYGGADGRLFHYMAKGCEHCGGTGYRGRIAAVEVVVVTPRLRALLLARPTENMIANATIDMDASTMTRDAIAKIFEGLTDCAQLAEVFGAD